MTERTMAKRWYVIHTQSGYEARVKARLEHKTGSGEFGDSMGEVLIPTEDVAEVKGGRRRVTTRKFFPGYVLVCMEMNDSAWYAVKSTSGVAGFVGAGPRPIPLSDAEVSRIMRATEEKKAKPKPKVMFEKADPVRVIEGPFANFDGVVEEANAERGKLRVMVTIFGRQTPVELEYWQVERV